MYKMSSKKIVIFVVCKNCFIYKYYICIVSLEKLANWLEITLSFKS